MIQLREKYKYGLVIPTSMGIRLTPRGEKSFQDGKMIFVLLEEGRDRKSTR